MQPPRQDLKTTNNPASHLHQSLEIRDYFSVVESAAELSFCRMQGHQGILSTLSFVLLARMNLSNCSIYALSAKTGNLDRSILRTMVDTLAKLPLRSFTMEGNLENEEASR
jgi:hypothetical protein